MITTKELLTKENITIVKDENCDYGYTIYQNGKRRAIFMLITQRYKNGAFKSYPATNYMVTLEDGSKVQKVETLHKMVYVYFVGDTNGLCIDHIDNDPCNNDLSNLNLVTRSENTKKDAVGHNQYTLNSKRVHQ